MNLVSLEVIPGSVLPLIGVSVCLGLPPATFGSMQRS